MNQPIKSLSQPLRVPRPNVSSKPLSLRTDSAAATAAVAEPPDAGALLDADVADEPTRQMSPQHLRASVRATVVAQDEASGIQRRAVQRSERADRVSEWFRLFARKAARGSGSPFAFAAAVAVILLWGVSGPIFHFSDTWQLVINTSTTIITFLMVFVVQATQNRDSEAIHLKLDELLRAVDNARSSLIDIETLPERDLQRLAEQLHQACGPRARAVAEIAIADKSPARPASNGS